MSGGMNKKQRRAKIKQQLKEQKAKKVTNELKDGFVNIPLVLLVEFICLVIKCFMG